MKIDKSLEKNKNCQTYLFKTLKLQSLKSNAVDVANDAGTLGGSAVVSVGVLAVVENDFRSGASNVVVRESGRNGPVR